jgi:phage terminase large subunit GpA-like protein
VVDVVPAGVAVITAGVDQQDDRLEAQILGWGEAEENWVLAYHVLYGDPAGPAIWNELWDLLCRPLYLERGGIDYIRATCVDTGGHYTQAAYEFCRPRHVTMTPEGGRTYVFAVKGRAGVGDQIWPTKPTFNNKGKVPLYSVRVDTAKEILYARLQRSVTANDPGYIHFPGGMGEHYFQQLTAERAHTGYDKKNRPVRTWALKEEGARNEALDTWIYGYAALFGLRAMGFDLDRAVAELPARRVIPEPVYATAPSSSAGPTPPGASPASSARRGRRVTRSTYLG